MYGLWSVYICQAPMGVLFIKNFFCFLGRNGEWKWTKKELSRQTIRVRVQLHIRLFNYVCDIIRKNLASTHFIV